jgi:N-acetylglutamate synthase-like GNAT family acetyltransferase
MEIRQMQQHEIRAAARIIGRNYSLRYERNAISEMGAMYNNPIIPPKYFVAVEKEKIIGCGAYIQSWMDYNVYNIFWINVDPKYQNRGVGTKLVNRIISDIKAQRGLDKRAEVVLLTTNKPEFYKRRFGFETLMQFERDTYDLMYLRLRR